MRRTNKKVVKRILTVGKKDFTLQNTNIRSISHQDYRLASYKFGSNFNLHFTLFGLHSSF